MIYLDVPIAQQTAQTLSRVSTILETVSNILQGIITVLLASAFLSLGTSEPLRQALENLKRLCEAAAEGLNRLSSNLLQAIDAYEREDFEAAGRLLSGTMT